MRISLQGSENGEDKGAVTSNPSCIQGSYFSGELSLAYLLDNEKIEKNRLFSYFVIKIYLAPIA